MGDEKDRGPLFTFSGLFIILAALGVTIFTPSPFKGSRPFAPDQRTPIAKVSARLWQDPFMAVIEHAETFKQLSSARSSNRLCLIVRYDNKQENTAEESDPFLLGNRMNDGKVTVLGVMISGNRFAEDSEQRIRYRYAVLSGLRRLGFIPEDPEHIEYVEFLPASGRKTGLVSLSDIMPFEWLRNSPEKDAVLLLWINDYVFSDNPLGKLNCLAGWAGISRPGQRNVSFKIIGPAGSDTLKAMLQDANETTAGGFSALNGTRIFSALATADDSLLLEGIGERQLPDNQAEDMVAAKFRKHEIVFTRTIRTDRELAGIILKELKRRNVKFDHVNDYILLVSEWDSFYGRSLNRIYKRILDEEKGPEVESRVRRVSYLRGIDGNLPGEKVERKDEKTDSKADLAAKPVNLEEPIGKSQYDYLRRLTQETYRNSLEEGSVKAIGVLGTDFYDKYLVLQAFHERFPQAIFFTTDLDARFLHPEAVKWTRNLVVASNFDLALRRDEKRNFQGDVPPFRDNYQTSLFFATLWAFSEDNYDNPVHRIMLAPYFDLALWRDEKRNLQGVMPPFRDNFQTSLIFASLHAFNEGYSANPFKEPPPHRIIKRIPEIVHPQLYEIGRYSAVKLSPDYDDINPGRNRSEKMAYVLSISIFISLVLVLLLFFTSSRSNRLISKVLLAAKKNWATALVIMLATTGGVLGFFRFVIGDPYEEPLSLFEGISVWPTEALRITAAVFATGFIIMAVRKLRENTRLIEQTFDLDSDGSGRESNVNKQSFFENLKKLAKDPNNYSFHWESEMTLKNLWREYVKRDALEYRILRLFPAMILYGCLCGSIIYLFGAPVSPVRGSLSSLIDHLALFVSVISFIILVFFVFDVIRNCRNFIDLAWKIVLDWHHGTGVIASAEHMGEAGPEKKSWDLMRLIAKRTDEVGKLIFYPFIVWLLMFLSRVQLFDNWHTPVGLAIVITMSAVFAWSSACFLRQSAEGARAGTIRFLREQRAAATFHEKPDEGKIRRIEFTLKEIADLREGAFAPFMKHPLVHALLVPFGGVGGVYLVDFLTKMNI